MTPETLAAIRERASLEHASPAADGRYYGHHNVAVNDRQELLDAIGEAWEAEEIGPGGDADDHDGAYFVFAGPDAREQAERLRDLAAERGVRVDIGPIVTIKTADEAFAQLWALED